MRFIIFRVCVSRRGLPPFPGFGPRVFHPGIGRAILYPVGVIDAKSYPEVNLWVIVAPWAQGKMVDVSKSTHDEVHIIQQEVWLLLKQECVPDYFAVYTNGPRDIFHDQVARPPKAIPRVLNGITAQDKE